MILERADSVLLPNRNPHGLNPALLTFGEYYRLINPSDKFHSNNAYDVDLQKLNAYSSKSQYDRLFRRIKLHGLNFEIWLSGGNTAQDEWGIGIFNGDTKVAAVEDEWGTLLVMVAREYRGFGFGPLLVKMARTIQPDRPSGGFTPAGYKNFIKVYQAMVRDAIGSGLYRRLIQQGQMSKQRVDDIITSAKLTKREIQRSRDLSSDDPVSWLLYVGEGDFLLYDRKVKELLADDDDRDEYFIDKMIKGYVYVQLHEGHRDNWAVLRRFGGDTPLIKRFLLNCATQYANENDMPLYLEPDEIEFIDKRMIERVENAGTARGFTSYKVIPTGEVLDYNGMATAERRWRASFDRYNEFFYRVLELANSKYQG
jgi:hypothetical protein